LPKNSCSDLVQRAWYSIQNRVPGIYCWNADLSPLKKRIVFKKLGGVIIRQPTLITFVSMCGDAL
jgi:hypothetical protein